MKLGVLIHSTFLWGEPETKEFVKALELHKIPYEIIQWDRNNFSEYTWKNQPVDLITSFGTLLFLIQTLFVGVFVLILLSSTTNFIGSFKFFENL